MIENAAKGIEGPPGALPAGALPAEFFVTGDGTRGSKDKGVFDSEAVCFGSKPEDRHDRYPTLARCTDIFNQACDRFASVVRSVDDSVLDRSIRWGPVESPVWSICLRMVFHNGMHTGEIADMRRALGFKSIFA